MTAKVCGICNTRNSEVGLVEELGLLFGILSRASFR
jgi:hypothetical protein